MRARNDRDGLTDGIDTGREARGGNGREPRREARDATRVQVGARIAGRFQPRVDGGRDHVTGRQVAHRMNTGGDRISLAVNQYRALAADGLGDQWAPATAATGARCVEKHRRVKLDELEIADWQTRPQRQRDAVTGGAIGIGGRTEQVPQPTGGQDHRQAH